MFKLNIFCGVLIKKATILKFALLVLLCSVLANEGFAATKTSTTLGGFFNLGTSWVGGVAPIAGDDVIIDGPIVITAHTVLVSSVQVTSNGVLSVSANNITLNVNGNVINNGTLQLWDPLAPTINGVLQLRGTSNLSGSGTWSIGDLAIGNTITACDLSFDDNLTFTLGRSITASNAGSTLNKVSQFANTTFVFNGTSAATIPSRSGNFFYPNIKVDKASASAGVTLATSTLPAVGYATVLGNIELTKASDFFAVGSGNTLDITQDITGLGSFRGTASVGVDSKIIVSGSGSTANLRLTSTSTARINDLIVDRSNGVILYSETVGGVSYVKNSIQLNNNSLLTLGDDVDYIGTLNVGTSSGSTGGIITGNGTIAGNSNTTLTLLGTGVATINFEPGFNALNRFIVNKGVGGTATINNGPDVQTLMQVNTAGKIILGNDLEVNAPFQISNANARFDINGHTLTLNNSVISTGSFIGSATSNLILGGPTVTSTLNFDQTSSSTSSLNDFNIERTDDANLYLSIASSLNVLGNLNITQPLNKIRPTLTATLTLSGTFSGNGLIAGGTSTTAVNLVLDGSGLFNLTTSDNKLPLFGGTFFKDLTINRAGGAELLNALTVTNQLQVTSASQLILPPAILTVGVVNTTAGNLIADGELFAQPTSSLYLYGNGATSPQLNFSQASVADKTLNNLTINRSGSAVVIPNTNELYVNNTFILTAGDLNIGDGKLYLNRAITTSSTGYLSANGNSELYITGTAVNTSYPLFFNPSANTLKLLNISRTGTGTITLSNALNITDNLDVSGTTSKLNANGFLTLVSTSSKTANVGPIANTASITGSVTAQRFVTGGSYNPYRSFRMLSSPVGGTSYTAAQLIDDIFVTGAGGSANGFDDSSDSQPSVFTYNEPATTASGLDYVSISNISSSVNTGQGLMVFYRGDRSDPSVMSSRTINPASTVMDFIGTLNQKNITRPLSYTANGESTDGFNLLGNPYQCTIDWDAAGWTKTGITGTIYVYNPAQRTYATYDGSFGANGGSQYIYPGQAFFVQATAGGASVTFTENIKASSVQPTSPLGGAPLLLSAPVFAKDRTLKLMEAGSAKQDSKSANIMQAPLQNGTQSLSNNVIKTRLEKGSFYDETVVVFKDNESSSYTANDAVRLDGGSGVALASQSTDQKMLAINYMDGIANVSSVKLYVGASASGNYILNFTDISLPSEYRTQLKDNYLNRITDISSASQYAFSVNTTEATSFGNNRFEILINNPTTLSVDLMAFTGKATTQGAMLNWKTSSEKDNDLFEVERSLDGQTFVKIGSVKSKSSNSTTPNNYEFLDTKPALGLNYYRLKQIDLDGTPTIIDPIALNFNGLALNDMKLTLYPNPTVDKINIAFASLNVKKGYISVVDALGKKLINKNIGGDGNEAQLSLDVNNLNPGIYFVEIYDGNKVISKGNKFIKQ